MSKVKTRGAYLEKNNHEFFYLADTAWLLLMQLRKEEAEYYFKTRAKQGFNGVEFVLIPEFDSLHIPNVYGEVPLKSFHETIIPNEKYFEFARWCVKTANHYGLTVGLYPTWGDKVNKRSGVGPEIFTPDNTYNYAKFVSDYFADLDIIFFLGGDKNPETEKHYKVFEEFVRGLRDGKSKDCLISYHVKGGYCSNDFFNEKQWLDFSIYQSGHTKYCLAESDRMKVDHFSPRSYDYAKKEISRKYVKPFLNGEPAYENHPQMYVDENGEWKPIRNPEMIYFTDYDVRKDAYWSVFYGASGFTYGANDIWQFTGEKTPIKAPSLSMTSWKIAMTLPGATQLQYLKNLLGHFADFQRKNAQHLLIKQSLLSPDAHIVVCEYDNKTILAYVPVEQSFKIDTSNIKSSKIKYSWYDPKNGLVSKYYVILNDGKIEFNSPMALDQVLIIEEYKDE